MRWVLIALFLIVVTMACEASNTPTAAPQATTNVQTAAVNQTIEERGRAATATVAAATEAAVIQASPTLDATPSSIATATPEAHVEIQSWTLIERSYGGTARVIGEVINSGDAPAQRIDVVVTLYDGAGTILVSGSAVNLMPIIPAGEKSPFSATFFGTDPADIADVRFQVQYTKHDPDSRSFRSHTSAFEVVQINWGAERITGEILNADTETVQYINIVIVGYYPDGEIFGLVGTTADLTILAPGETSPFTVSSADYESQPDMIRVYAWGQRT